MSESGDTFHRRFIGDVAQCGCRWTRTREYGDVLVECPLHKAAGQARFARFERKNQR